MDNGQKYFLPYQIAWLKDESPVKIWDKSRRIGATYVQAFEDVRDAGVLKSVPKVWFSSADETAGKEYIEYCEQWARLYHIAAENMGEVVIDREKDIKATQIQFANGAQIHALSSNPKGFRSKGGKVILDEFAFHEKADALWAAARPVITWGFPLRILSTQNGKQCRYFRFLDAIEKGKLDWSKHQTTIYDAVEQGLLDRIRRRKTTEAERKEWLKQQEQDCADNDTWLQEYCCVAVDAASAFLTYNMITSVEIDPDKLLKELTEIGGDLFIGMDIARKKHFSVIWGLEKLGLVNYTRFVRLMVKMKFAKQREILYGFLEHKRMRRACIDSTGIGMQLSEEARDKFGKNRVEQVNFSASVKEHLAYGIRNDIEERLVYVPDDFDIREDLHSVKKTVTDAGNIRLDAAASDAKGHADRFWALALARHAGSDKNSGPVRIASRKPRKAKKDLEAF